MDTISTICHKYEKFTIFNTPITLHIMTYTLNPIFMCFVFCSFLTWHFLFLVFLLWIDTHWTIYCSHTQHTNATNYFFFDFDGLMDSAMNHLLDSVSPYFFPFFHSFFYLTWNCQTSFLIGFCTCCQRFSYHIDHLLFQVTLLSI